jgi:hypothetical protein
MSEIKIKFKSWDKHQPRKDYKRPHWFALANDFSIDQKFHDFSNEEKLCFVYLLCEASRQNKRGEMTIIVDHWCRVNNLTRKILLQTIDKIESVQIAYRVRTESERYITIHNNTEQNITEQNKILLAQTDESASLHPDCYSDVVDVFTQRGVKAKVTGSWIAAFPDATWVVQEIRKALAWEASNPGRRKKDFGRFMTNWLSRSWDSRRPNQNLNKAEQRDAHNAAAAKEALRLMGIE